MNYLVIKNWRKHQHYTGRNPPWIKLATRLLDSAHDDGDAAYCALPDFSKILLVHLWILASRYNVKADEARLPYDLTFLNAKLNLKTRVSQKSFYPLIASGLVKISVLDNGVASTSPLVRVSEPLDNSVLVSEVPEGESEGKQRTADLTRLRILIRSLGLRVTNSVETLLALWSISPGIPAVAEIIERCREGICAADHPMQYLAAIVKRHGEKPATPEPEVVPELSREDIANLMKRDVWRWLDSNGDPDMNDIARAKFNAEWSQIGGEDYEGCRWDRWLSVAMEFGFDAKPRQEVSA